MMNSKWLLALGSSDPSPSWEDYADRYSRLLVAISAGLSGEVIWRDDTQEAEMLLDRENVERLKQILIDGQLRNDLGELMPGAGSRLFLVGRRMLPPGTTSLLLTGGFGGVEHPCHASLEVKEPGETLWSYPDETIAGLIGGALAAIDGDRARARHRFLHRLLIKAGAPFEVGSHVYMGVPLDDPSRFPPGARQVRCGEGWLLIVPPGATDEETLERMRWVAAAIGVE